VALDHNAKDARLTAGDLIGDATADIHLALVLPAAVAVAEINHDPLNRFAV